MGCPTWEPFCGKGGGGVVKEALEMWTTCRTCAPAGLIVALCVGNSVRAQCAGYQVDYLYGYNCGITGYAGVNFKDINDLGNACGARGHCSEADDMIIWNGNEVLLQVPITSTFGAQALSINDSNVIAGTGELPSGQNRGFVYVNGAIEFL